MDKSTTRMNNSIKNISYAFVGQIFGLVASFLLRMVFVKQLSQDYLGIDSLFASIISMLALAELGVGSAINFSLYKPISKNDTEKIKSLMQFYKKIYRIIGLAIFIIGVIITPVIVGTVNSTIDTSTLKFVFILFVTNSSISYFLSYKKTLIVADQHRHITVVYKYSFYVVMIILQIFILLVYKNYILYLIITNIFTFLENYAMSKKADKLYPFLRDKEYDNLDKKSKSMIAKNAYAMSFHKIGGVVVNSTDNIVIGKFVGLVSVGLYSNYLLITNALNLIFGQIFNSIIASIGNLGVEEDKEDVERAFNFVLYCCFVLVSFSTVMLINLLNPFIEIWLGEKYLLSNTSVFLISLNFFIIQIRRAVLSFRDALGLYWYDRYKPLVEALLNIIFSITFVKLFGINGVFFGTILSMILTSLWVEPYILYKYAFDKKPSIYYKKLGLYFVQTVLLSIITFKGSRWLASLVSINLFVNFIFLIFASFIIFITLFFLINVRSKHFKKIMTIIFKKK